LKLTSGGNRSLSAEAWPLPQLPREHGSPNDGQSNGLNPKSPEEKLYEVHFSIRAVFSVGGRH
jgi:hypothetical protein